MIILPFTMLKIHLIETIEYRYKYDNSQLYLLTLLSKTHNGELVYDQIASNLQTGDPDISFVKSEMVQMVGTTCFNLSSTYKVIAHSDCVPSKHIVSARIALPYNPNNLVDTLTLVID